ncbi:hypothetical protein P153DRAFT_354426 [Dothidotthia symphoricarpi CBS 119687]|uniref:Mid2 domain-containing protein n=1 Tax=Dothidotthia symphoricarpi CBS 119687 TaxID=1392245 RepID=A0A6A6AQ55_9PLEO|nr:uncharacterized protein P153DRAFT_354426 [Dothidotthia symphoricarpi CBS 119687]KAF2132987.1 hypothetical protein P153DRAFT_354426 [Dothidotthia symphoricarpi CBS 119687]
MHFPGQRVAARQIGSIFSSIGGELTSIFAGVTASPISLPSLALPSVAATTTSSSAAAVITTSAPAVSTSPITPSSTSTSTSTSSSTPTTNRNTSTLATSTSASDPIPSPSTSSISTSTNTPTSAKSSSTNIAAIVGGVVGGLAVLGIVIIALYWIKRRHPSRSKAEPELEASYIAPPKYESSTPPEVTHAHHQTPDLAPQEVDGRWNQVYELPAERK